MPTWDAILEHYLEGAGSRAAAESLRFRIALPAEGRREVENVLRLADCLADATRSARPPAGAAQRLGERLGHAGEPDVRPNWLWDGSDFIPPDGVARAGAEEDACNAAIEGATDRRVGPAPFAGAVPRQDLQTFELIAAVIRSKTSSPPDSAPPGAIERLRSKLARAIEAGEGGASPGVAGRIMAQLRDDGAKPQASVGPPDVLAAGKDLEDAEGPPNDADLGPSEI